MKKLFAVVLAIALVLSVSTPASAYNWYAEEEYNATATVGGSGSFNPDFSATLKNFKEEDEGNTDTLLWDSPTPDDKWLRSKQYIEVTGFATYPLWGIQIYTDNKGDDANPKYEGTGNPAGLVRVSEPGSRTLPMCWRTVAPEEGEEDPPGYNDPKLEIYEEEVDDTIVLDDGIRDDEYYPWFFMIDKRTDMDDDTEGDQYFGNYHEETTFLGRIEDSKGDNKEGYHHAPGSTNWADFPPPEQTFYVYFGARFTYAVVGETYTSNTVTIEAFHE